MALNPNLVQPALNALLPQPVNWRARFLSNVGQMLFEDLPISTVKSMIDLKARYETIKPPGDPDLMNEPNGEKIYDLFINYLQNSNESAATKLGHLYHMQIIVERVQRKEFDKWMEKGYQELIGMFVKQAKRDQIRKEKHITITHEDVHHIINVLIAVYGDGK
jgi:hypothetical protein